MHLEFMTFEVKAHIAWATFNRPEKLNALNPAVFRDIEKVVAACEDDGDIRVLVLRGNEKAFAAGADIEHMARSGIRDVYGGTDRSTRIQERLADLPKPTIAAVSGYALGGGCEVSLCCDFRIAADTAVMGLPEINLGIIPGGGGTQRLPRLIGIGPATRLILTGDMIPAVEAARLGLLDTVVPIDALESTVVDLAKKLMQQPALAVRAAKTAIRRGMGISLKDGLQLEQDLFCMLFGTSDQKEGMAAFLEKRKPVFRGE